MFILLNVDVHFNIGKNWLQIAVEMSNEKNRSLLLFIRFLSRFCFFFVLFFTFFAIVSSVTTTFDKFQFQSQVRLSQCNVKDPIRSKFKVCSFHQVRSQEFIPVRGTTRLCHLLGLTLQSSQKLSQKVGTENCLTKVTIFACKCVSLWSTGLLGVFCWKDSLLLTTTTQPFSEGLQSQTSCRALGTFPTTYNPCNFWRSKLHQISDHMFCRCYKIFS